jgi:DNA-directed RNA polymerase subunit beta'
MRTFHTGGVASADDITRGLPRVTELLEARTRARVRPHRGGRRSHHHRGHGPQPQLILTPDNGEPIAYLVLKRYPPRRGRQHVELGQQLHVGAIDPKEVLRVRGVPRCADPPRQRGSGRLPLAGCADPRQAHRVIVRQMLRKVTVVDHGDTGLLPGELVDRLE